jgi:Putative MetA-pathway of phenol degradation
MNNRDGKRVSMRRAMFLAGVCLASTAAPASAQAPYNLTAPVNNLATIFTDIFGERGLVVDSLATLEGEQPHTAHFASDFQFNFSQFSTALVGQLVSVPLPSPAGGFTYEFDPSLGVFRRTTQSFGPIIADRAETIGARRFSIGFAYQRFTFDTVEGLDLRRVPAVFTHDSAELRGGREDVVTTVNSIGVNVNQSTTFLTMGVTDHLDLSVALPIVSTSMTIVSEATIQRLGTTNELTHFFRQSDGAIGDQRTFTASGSASGIGDLMVRVKSHVRQDPKNGVAVGLDLRLPTGDEMNLLGSGATGIQPFVIWSGTFDKLSPHVNASYRWNGSSVLAGDPARGIAADFPDQVGYGLGAELSVTPRVTLAADLFGRYVIDAERLRQESFRAFDAAGTPFQNIVFTRDSYNALSGAIGFKANVAGSLLIDVNMLFKLNENGLRDKLTPLIGLEYSF